MTGDVFISRDVRFMETEMPGVELDLPGPRYEPMSGEQPGSVGESAGDVPVPVQSVPHVPSLILPLPRSDSDSDSDSDSNSGP